MSEALGTIRYAGDHGDDEVFLGRDFNTTKGISDHTAALIDAEIKKIIDEAYANAKEILSSQREKLDFIAEFLVKNEIMDDEQFKAAMDAEAPTQDEIEAIGEEKRRRSAEENKLREAAEAEARRRDEEEARRRAEEAKAREGQSGEPFDPYKP